MSAGERIEHPALVEVVGRELAAADLTDQQRVSAVLQAAGLLSLCEVAGWRICDHLTSARFDAEARLRGVRVEPGRAEESAQLELARFARRLFGGGESIAGRGAARAAMRRVLVKWDSALDRGSADAAVSTLLDAAPFLVGAPFSAAREALSGGLTIDGEVHVWRAGRERREGSGGSTALAMARALWSIGKAERAIEALAGCDDVEAETLRVEALMHLGQLGAAREAVRRLERRKLTVAERLAAGDVALNVLAVLGEQDAARDWVARAIAEARGPAKRGARLLAALAALDRGDLEGAETQLEAAGSARGDDPYSRLELEARLTLAQRRHQTAEAMRLATERLARGRRRMGLARAGRAWNGVGYARSLAGDFRGAERAYAHSARLLRRTDGPLALTLAGFNLADTRLRRGQTHEVDTLIAQSMAHNRRSGNEAGLAEDELLAIRYELVKGAWQAAADRSRRRIEAESSALTTPVRDRLAVLGARALGWLGRVEQAAELLRGVDDAAFGELEPEEMPFLLALAGETDRAVERASSSPLARTIVGGQAPPPHRWREIDGLEPFRRARFALDAELTSPGAVPGDRLAAAAEVFRGLGATLAVAVCERRSAAGWSALASFLERPAGDRAALEDLLASLGHPEAELVVRDGSGERRLAGSAAPRGDLDERIVPLGDGELVLRAVGIDEPLRTVLALVGRDLPPVAAAAGPLERSSLLGESPALRAATQRLAKFAASELPVLILGENGTGKELAALDVHRLSERRKGPWVAVNCAGLSETLLLSELFGHARGAFTGADQARAGLFETARGGTLFLDEVGDLPPTAQGSLLRALQEGEIRRLGESLPRKVDARIVAATNRDLETMVEQGTFRQDLYFRLKAATVVLPPLRERGQDVVLLAERFVDELRARGRDLRLIPEARRALTAHVWPGNVRELRNAIAAAAVLAEGGAITAEDLDLAPTAAPAGDGDYHRQVEEFRIRLVRRALEAADGSLAGAARQLGVTRQFLSQFVRKHGLQVTR